MCRAIRRLRQQFPRVPILALTATATPRVAADITTQLQMRASVLFTASFNRANLEYSVVPKTKRVVEAMADRIVERHLDKLTGVAAGLVYCLSRADTEKVAEELEARPGPRDARSRRRTHTAASSAVRLRRLSTPVQAQDAHRSAGGWRLLERACRGSYARGCATSARAFGRRASSTSTMPRARQKRGRLCSARG